MFRPERASSSAEFAAKLADDVKKNSAPDPEFAASFGATRGAPVDGLGVPAAWHDVRAVGQVWLDAVKQREGGGYYLRVMADSIEIAKAFAKTAVGRLR